MLVTDSVIGKKSVTDFVILPRATTPMEFSEKLDYLLKLRGIKQRDLADAIDTYPQRVNEWMKGQSTPNLKLSSRIADFLGVSLDLLADELDFPSFSSQEDYEKWAMKMEEYLKLGRKRFVVANRVYSISGITNVSQSLVDRSVIFIEYYGKPIAEPVAGVKAMEILNSFCRYFDIATEINLPNTYDLIADKEILDKGHQVFMDHAPPSAN